MRFEVGDFAVKIEKKVEYLEDKIAVPGEIKLDRPARFKLINKKRYLTIFVGLGLFDAESDYHIQVIYNLFDFIDLIEVLKAFNSNKLDTNKEYNINNKFTAKIATKDKEITLKLQFENHPNIIYLDKFECSSLAAKFGKILQRCEVWQEREV